MDAVEQKMINEKIEDARFEGYVAGKRVMKQWAKNCEKLQKCNYKN
jgi:hypothetical protein